VLEPPTLTSRNHASGQRLRASDGERWTARSSGTMIKGYEAGLSHGVPDDDDIPEPIDRILQQASKRRWRNLAEERIKDVTPTIRSTPQCDRLPPRRRHQSLGPRHI
jgi:hypothetical protein